MVVIGISAVATARETPSYLANNLINNSSTDGVGDRAEAGGIGSIGPSGTIEGLGKVDSVCPWMELPLEVL